MSGVLDASDPDSVGIPSLTGPQGEEVARMSAAANEWVAFGLVTIGSFLLIGGCLSYWRAVRWVRVFSLSPVLELEEGTDSLFLDLRELSGKEWPALKLMRNKELNLCDHSGTGFPTLVQTIPRLPLLLSVWYHLLITTVLFPPLASYQNCTTRISVSSSLVIIMISPSLTVLSCQYSYP